MDNTAQPNHAPDTPDPDATPEDDVLTRLLSAQLKALLPPGAEAEARRRVWARVASDILATEAPGSLASAPEADDDAARDAGVA